jgi:hypothetical protein
MAMLKTTYALRYVKVKLSRYKSVEGPLGFPEVEAPEFLDNRHMKVLRLSALRTIRLYPSKNSWYSFLLEAESTSGPQCDRKVYVTEKFQ